MEKSSRIALSSWPHVASITSLIRVSVFLRHLAQSSLRGRRLGPSAGGCPDQQCLAVADSVVAGPFVPRAAVGPQPLQRLQVAPLSSVSTRPCVPVAAVLASPSAASPGGRREQLVLDGVCCTPSVQGGRGLGKRGLAAQRCGIRFAPPHRHIKIGRRGSPWVAVRGRARPARISSGARATDI